MKSKKKLSAVFIAAIMMLGVVIATSVAELETAEAHTTGKCKLTKKQKAKNSWGVNRSVNGNRMKVGLPVGNIKRQLERKGCDVKIAFQARNRSNVSSDGFTPAGWERMACTSIWREHPSRRYVRVKYKKDVNHKVYQVILMWNC